MTDQRTTWREQRKQITHAVTAFDVAPVDFDVRTAREIRTDCGIELPDLALRDDGPVTCALCLDAEWLDGIASELESETEKETPEAMPTAHAPFVASSTRALR